MSDGTTCRQVGELFAIATPANVNIYVAIMLSPLSSHSPRDEWYHIGKAYYLYLKIQNLIGRVIS